MDSCRQISNVHDSSQGVPPTLKLSEGVLRHFPSFSGTKRKAVVLSICTNYKIEIEYSGTESQTKKTIVLSNNSYSNAWNPQFWVPTIVRLSFRKPIKTIDNNNINRKTGCCFQINSVVIITSPQFYSIIIDPWINCHEYHFSLSKLKLIFFPPIFNGSQINNLSAGIKKEKKN